MRNVTFVGLCWAMTLGLVAVALGQQQAPATGQAAQPSAAWQAASDQSGLPAPQAGAIDRRRDASGRSRLDQQPAVPAPNTQQDRSLLSGGQTSGQQSTMSGGQQRGELGVWMAESGGPGVQIVRVTPSSAAAQAGLHVGDIVLQVNGRGASSPQRAAEMIRQIPIGQTGTLTIWRDGDQRQLQVTMQAAPARSREMDRPIIGREMTGDSYQVGFRGDEEPASGGSSARILRLEQQISSLTQELTAMRQELAQLRSAGSVQTTGFNTEVNQGSTPPAPPAPTSATAPAPASSLAPPPGFGQTEEKASKSATEPAKPATPPAPTAPPAKSAAPAPTAEKPAGNDLFGTESQPKGSEKPKAEEKKPANDTKGGGDDLFK